MERLLLKGFGKLIVARWHKTKVCLPLYEQQPEKIPIREWMGTSKRFKFKDIDERAKKKAGLSRRQGFSGFSGDRLAFI